MSVATHAHTRTHAHTHKMTDFRDSPEKIRETIEKEDYQREHIWKGQKSIVLSLKRKHADEVSEDNPEKKVRFGGNEIRFIENRNELGKLLKDKEFKDNHGLLFKYEENLLRLIQEYTIKVNNDHKDTFSTKSLAKLLHLYDTAHQYPEKVWKLIFPDADKYNRDEERHKLENIFPQKSCLKYNKDELDQKIFEIFAPFYDEIVFIKEEGGFPLNPLLVEDYIVSKLDSFQIDPSLFD